MKKAIFGLLVMGLVSVSTPAMAQVPGSEDPLGLITSGLILPYVGGGSSESWLEIAAPLLGVDFHAFFYDESCVRQGDSVGIGLTPNDIAVLRLDNLGGAIPTTGLMTGASVDPSGFVLEPLSAPVHARVFWVDFGHNRVRILEPIALSTRDTFPPLPTSTVADDYGWNPLRTGATFFAPLEQSGMNTTIYFICPNRNIAGTGTQVSTGSRAFGPGSGFPRLVPAAQVAGQTTPLRVRVYDDEERFLRDVNHTCNCLTVSPVTAISAVYADAFQVRGVGTYTEVEGHVQAAVDAVCSTTEVVPAGANSVCPFVPDTNQEFRFRLLSGGVPEGGPFSFTGYRGIVAGSLDVFGRLSNGDKCDLQGGSFCTNPSPNFR